MDNNIKFINLNNTMLNISDFDYGKHTIILKKHNKKYYLDIDKTSNDTFIELYDYISKDRNSFSKYDKKVTKCFLRVNNQAILNRDFFDNMPNLAHAIAILKCSSHYSALIL